LKCLEAVEIESFGGEGHEIDLLTLLFRCAPLMKRVTLNHTAKIYQVLEHARKSATYSVKIHL
jgi:hypothetical protein